MYSVVSAKADIDSKSEYFIILQNSDVKLYPNPATDEFNVQFVASNSGILQVKLYNALGSVVFAEKYNFNEGNVIVNIQLDQYKIRKGMYYVSLESEDVTKTQKLILK